jgi:hypothetical protein
LTTQQLQTLFFPSSHTAYARLSALYHHAYLDRKFLGVHADKMNTPILYVLDKRGAALLQAERGLEVVWSQELRHLTFSFLEHTLAINTVRVAVTKACEQPGFSLLRWSGENELKADYDYVTIRTAMGRIQSVSVIPDSFILLDTPRGKAAFCLELDRGTMTTARFKTKVEAYMAYYSSGGYQRRYGTRSLRVLTVTPSQGRVASLRRVTEAAQGKQRFWFTTLDQISPVSVLTRPIWEVATKPEREALI